MELRFNLDLSESSFSVMCMHTLKATESPIFLSLVSQPASSGTGVVDLTTGVWIPPPDFNVSCLISHCFHSFIGLHSARSTRVLQGSHTTQLDPLDKPRHLWAFKKLAIFSHRRIRHFCDGCNLADFLL